MPRLAPAAVSLLSLLRKAAYKARRRTATKKIFAWHMPPLSLPRAPSRTTRRRVNFGPWRWVRSASCIGDIGTSPIYAFREAVVAATGEAAVVHDTCWASSR